MEAIKKVQWQSEGSWMATLASLLPLWLLSVAVMVEGFPKPPIPLGVAVAAFVLAIPVSIVLLRKGWMEIDLLIYSLFPILLFFIFDEISTTYKSPFILLCVLLLSIGIVGAQRTSRSTDSVTVRWLILFFVAAVTWVVASHAAQSYWQMVGDLGYGAFPLECMPDTQGCPLTGDLTPWWILFFRP
jgi:hypothetical protein